MATRSRVGCWELIFRFREDMRGCWWRILEPSNSVVGGALQVIELLAQSGYSISRALAAIQARRSLHGVMQSIRGGGDREGVYAGAALFRLYPARERARRVS